MAELATSVLIPSVSQQPAHFFRHAAVRIARHTLGQIEQSGARLAEPVRIQALHILPYALHIDDQWPLARDLLLRLADKLEQSGHREGWLPFLEQGLRLSQQQQDTKTMAELHLRIGYLLQLSGKYAAACAHYAASTTAFRDIGQFDRCARVLNRYAYTARQQQKRAQALHLVEEAFRIVSADHPEWANACLVRGWLAFDEQHWQEAHEHFRKAVTALTQHGTSYQLACALRDLAGALHLLERNDEAITTYKQALASFAQLGNQFQQAVIMMNLGVVYLVDQQPSSALAYFAQAEPTFQQLHDREHLSQLYLNQGIAYRMSEQPHHSVRLLQAAIELFEQIGNAEWLANAVDELGVTFLHMGETNRAVTTFREAMTILTSAPETSVSRVKEITEHLQAALRSLAQNGCCAFTSQSQSSAASKR